MFEFLSLEFCSRKEIIINTGNKLTVVMKEPSETKLVDPVYSDVMC